MSEKLKQSLSAAIDDEADEFELRRVLDELDTDPELRGLWERYHLFGSVLRGERTGATLSLRERVWLSLEAPDMPNERGDADHSYPDAVAPAAAPAGSMVGRRAGFAVAASVAVAVVLGIAFMNSSEDLPPQSVVQADAPTVPSDPAAVRESVVVPASGFRLAADASPSDLRRARAYMLHHTQQQALNQAGVMNFVKMATYESP